MSETAGLFIFFGGVCMETNKKSPIVESDPTLVKLIEELSMNAWASLQTRQYDGWILRFADGYTKRANSVNPLYESSMDPDEKIDICERQYRLHNLPVVFKLTAESRPKGIDQRLEERGYKKIDETSVRILDLSQYIYREPQNVFIETQFSDKWIDGFFRCSNIMDDEVQVTARKILNNILDKVICISVYSGKDIVGCGFGAVERNYVGIFDIVVDRNFRGNGYGKDVMDGILSEAVKMGVGMSYLQVVAGNLPAENLYGRLGYSEVYRYWYRKLG